MAYLTNQQMLQRIDARIIGDLVGDVNERATPAQLQTDVNLATAISDAAGFLNANFIYAGRYTVVQIQALTGDDLAMIQHMNAVVALAYLNQRRGLAPDANNPGYKQVMDMIEQIRTGTILLAVPSAMADSNPTVTYPSFTTYARVRLLRDVCTSSPAGLFAPRPLQQPSGLGST